MSIIRGLPRPVFTVNPLRLPVVQIKNGTFYKQNIANEQTRSKLFPDLSFNVPAPGKEVWAVVGPGSCGKTTFLEILRGLHTCDPTQARQFPALMTSDQNSQQRSLDPLKVIRYVGFGSKSQSLGPADMKGAYLSARFESRREDSDFSLADYLVGNVNLNPDESERTAANAAKKEYFFQFVAERMNLHNLLDMPVSNLSNGQTRRARVGRALMSKPHLLLLDEPFIGLDPMTKKSFNNVLHRLIRENDLPIVFALQAQEEIPPFVSHVLYLNEERKEEARGRRDSISTRGQLLFAFKSPWKHFEQTVSHRTRRTPTASSVTSHKPATNIGRTIPGETPVQTEAGEPGQSIADQQSPSDHPSAANTGPEETALWWDMGDLRTPPRSEAEPEHVVEMAGVKVAYGTRTIIGDWEQAQKGERKPGLWWTINPGDRWGVFGPNGSGKTTLLSLICSDHPQAYSLPIKLFGRSRLPTPAEPGISIFDLQARIGQSSPEVLNFFPKHLTVRQTIESAWADTFLSRPRLSHKADEAVDACLRWFQPELAPTDLRDVSAELLNNKRFDQLSAKWVAQYCAAYKEQDVEWAEKVHFGELSFEGQKVALFLRALVKKPELVILDEAFSGMDEPTRAKCMLFLAYGERRMFSQKKAGQGSKFKGIQDNARIVSPLSLNNEVTLTGLEPRQALLCVSHRRQEVPPILQQWLCLPESGEEIDDAPEVKQMVRTPKPRKKPPPPPIPAPFSDTHGKVPARFGTFHFGDGPRDDDWLRGSWWQRIWGGESWSPDGSYMMVEKLPFYKWQNQTRRKGYDIRKPESKWGAKTWLKRFKGAEARRQRLEWRAGRSARAEWEQETKAKTPDKMEGRVRRRATRMAREAAAAPSKSDG